MTDKCISGMGEIRKWSQINEMILYGAERDTVFYAMRWIWKFSFKHCLMNDMEIFKILAETILNDA